MPSSKKPRKKHTQGKVIKGYNMPVPLKRQRVEEMTALAALASLKSGTYDQRTGLTLVMFLAQFKPICEDNPEALRLMLAGYKVLNEIKDRHTRTGKWGATGDELKVIGDVIPAFIELIPQLTRDEFTTGALYAEKKLAQTLLKKP